MFTTEKGGKNADGADMLKVARRIGHFITNNNGLGLVKFFINYGSKGALIFVMMFEIESYNKKIKSRMPYHNQSHTLPNSTCLVFFCS